MSAGRFAPSPTSSLHVGNLRTALLAWLDARSSGVQFLLRIEDLDQARVAAARGIAEEQLRDLAELGIDWDGQPLIQSQRVDIYRDAASQLETYECFCTRREIAEASQAPHGSYRPYPGTCANLTASQRDRRRQQRPAAIRVRAGGQRFTVHDRHGGKVTAVVDDFVLFRADGTPAYNLATVVDDGLTGVTTVCRGDDLLESSPRQGWLAARLGFQVPEYFHVGLAVNSAGQRLAKRDGAVTLSDLKANGVTVERVVETLATSAGLPARSSAEEILASIPADGISDPKVFQPWIVSEREFE